MISFKFYTPDWGWLYGSADAKTYGFMVLIKREFKDDRCLLVHELTHVKQFWRMFKGEFKSKCEREQEAYNAQWECMGKVEIIRLYFNEVLKKYCRG